MTPWADWDWPRFGIVGYDITATVQSAPSWPSRPVQIEYPKFVHTHSLVVGQVVRQWTANLVFLCDRCLHRALSLFLEWLLAAELGPAEDKSAEFKRRVGEVRQRLLGPGPALRVSWCPRGGGEFLAHTC